MPEARSAASSPGKYKNTPKEMMTSHEIISHLASSLDDAGVDHVLWGNMVNFVHGVPTIVENIDFVLPDSQLEKAIGISLATGCETCADIGTCHVTNTTSPAPPPAAHVHHSARRQAIAFHKQSQTLWNLESLKVAADIKNVTGLPDVVFADDAGRLAKREYMLPHEERYLGLHPARVPTALRLLEAYVDLFMRRESVSAEIWWDVMITYIMEYVEGKGRLDLSLLRPEHERHLREVFGREKSKVVD